MIQEERIQALNDRPPQAGRYVLYWMQASQRVSANHALECAIREANARRLPVVVCFGLTDSYPEANERHYRFMLEGLREVAGSLADRRIGFVLRRGPPPAVAISLGQQAALAVCDRGYLRLQRGWRAEVAASLPCPLVQVESDVVVPVEVASAKLEFAARTFRPRLQRQLARYLVPLRESTPHQPATGLNLETLEVSDVGALLGGLAIDRSAGGLPRLIGGEGEARAHLAHFVSSQLGSYATLRNDPSLDCVSHMSPYLHFGQISPLTIALLVQSAGGPGAGPYLEELLVRRELSVNYVFYNAHYDAFCGLPAWARRSLEKHRHDRREYIYSPVALELAQTHDPYWNAAQREMVITGKMHGYMRMYWGKKIIEWSETPEEAMRVALYLNNKYEIDGRDPNGYTGVAWCLGQHDRPWKERPVLGTIRAMTAAGLRRKFDIDAYVRKVEEMSA